MPRDRAITTRSRPRRRCRSPARGRWSRFCDHLATLDQWDASSRSGGTSRARLRNWTFESAALDLALRQAGLSLPEALGREPRPLTFVNSLGLGDEPSADTIRAPPRALPERRLQARRGTQLDAARSSRRWPATGAVRTVDFKGRYGLEVEDDTALGALYDAVLEAFPDALIEDPHEPYMDRAAGRARLLRRADRRASRHHDADRQHQAVADRRAAAAVRDLRALRGRAAS